MVMLILIISSLKQTDKIMLLGKDETAAPSTLTNLLLTYLGEIWRFTFTGKQDVLGFYITPLNALHSYYDGHFLHNSTNKVKLQLKKYILQVFT